MKMQNFIPKAWADKEVATPAYTLVDGADSDNVPNPEPDTYSDGSWIAGEPHGAPATSDLDTPIGRESFAQGVAEMLRLLTERDVGVRAEQADVWNVTRRALAADTATLLAPANPDRIRLEIHRIGTGNAIYVAPSEGDVRSVHSSLLVLETVPFQSDSINEIWGNAVGGAEVVQVVQWFRSGMAQGRSVRYGGI